MEKCKLLMYVNYRITLISPLNIPGASNPRVQKFFTNGTLVAIIGTKGSGDGQLLKPEHVAIDPLGNLYVVDRGNARMQVFEPLK